MVEVSETSKQNMAFIENSLIHNIRALYIYNIWLFLAKLLPFANPYGPDVTYGQRREHKNEE